jgi:multiple sugar transport system substrate-binding protein
MFEQYGINPADYIRNYGGPNEIGRWTPEEFRNLLRAIKPKLPSNVYPYGFWCGSAMGDTYSRLMMTIFGSTNFDPTTKRSTSNSPENIQALQFLTDCYKEGLFAPGAETLTVLDVYQLLLNKQLAVSIFNNVNYDNLEKGLADGTIQPPFDIKVMFLPSVKDPICYAVIKGSAVFKQKNTMQTEAAKQLVGFYSHDPYAKGSLAMLPLRRSIARMMNDPLKVAIVDSVEYAGDFWMQVPGYNALRPTFFPVLQAALTGAKTPQQALEDFTRDSNEMIEDYAVDSVFNKK